MRESTKVPFKLKDIETLQWAIHPEYYSKDMDEYNISVKSDFGCDPNEKAIHCMANISLSQKDKVFLIIESNFIFLIEPNAWKTMLSNGDFVLSKLIKEHFLVLAIGTLRGIIFEKTNNKKLDTIVLPTIDVRHDTGDDLVFPLCD